MLRDEESGGGGGQKRFQCKLLGRTAAIRFINQHAMEDNAYEYVYGVRVARDVRRPLMRLSGAEAEHNKHPTAEMLNELVRDANNCSKPTARKTIKRAVDCGLITEERDGANVFYFLTAEEIADNRENPNA
jgi:histone H3/H4